ncbi:hypothetical protein NDU88_006992 [Pleurodeles waltl]|uniref:Uncharacterized protein n=1 Tax=Pleurodeles waltl TaxID=8319 RepID=A0AAV7QQ78_PLEWA|nr:hypothetical protein NDU88_006992 [Pleurodeles waltl]
MLTEHDREPGLVPRRLRAAGREAQLRPQRALTSAAGPKPGSRSQEAYASAPVPRVPLRSLGALEVEPVHSQGRHPSRPLMRSAVRANSSRNSAQRAASSLNSEPPLLLRVLGDKRVGACLEEDSRCRRQDY